MKQVYLWAARLWLVQVITGLLLVVYVVVHTIDNGAILISQQLYEDALALWHSLPGWLYALMVLGLATFFVIHMANGIRIASKPYKQVEISWKHNWMLKHPGTGFWFTQVLTGSLVAIFGVWHLIVQHGADQTTTAAQSAARVTPIVYLAYFVFIAAIMFHSFNGIRSVLLKMGIMTDKAKENILIGLMALLFIIFFLIGVLSIGKFLASPETFPVDESRMHGQGAGSVEMVADFCMSFEGGRSPATVGPVDPERMA